jgi:hypothetical protein
MSPPTPAPIPKSPPVVQTPVPSLSGCTDHGKGKGGMGGRGVMGGKKGKGGPKSEHNDEVSGDGKGMMSGGKGMHKGNGKYVGKFHIEY